MPFTHSVVSGGAFTLDNDDADNAYDSKARLTPDSSGRYLVTLEEVPEKHRLEAIECDSVDVTVELDQRRVFVDFDDQDVVCNFIIVGNVDYYYIGIISNCNNIF